MSEETQDPWANLHLAPCALWDEVVKVNGALKHLTLTLRLWRYRVGANPSWVDGWLLLRGYAKDHRLTFREAWAVTAVLFK